MISAAAGSRQKVYGSSNSPIHVVLKAVGRIMRLPTLVWSLLNSAARRRVDASLLVPRNLRLQL
jgi:hypothetical protein